MLMCLGYFYRVNSILTLTTYLLVVSVPLEKAEKVRNNISICGSYGVILELENGDGSKAGLDGWILEAYLNCERYSHSSGLEKTSLFLKFSRNLNRVHQDRMLREVSRLPEREPQGNRKATKSAMLKSLLQA